jgi:hypothetical protein
MGGMVEDQLRIFLTLHRHRSRENYTVRSTREKPYTSDRVTTKFFEWGLKMGLLPCYAEIPGHGGN